MPYKIPFKKWIKKRPNAEQRKVLAAERTKRAAECRAEIDAVLKRHHCAINAEMTIGQNSVRPSLTVVALEKE